MTTGQGAVSHPESVSGQTPQAAGLMPKNRHARGPSLDLLDVVKIPSDGESQRRYRLLLEVQSARNMP